jgi:tripartite-type tricarboxylate transporter receptor subunit TctC
MYTRRQNEWKIGSAVFVYGLFLFMTPASASAQSYPTKPISILVTFAPAGNLDTMTRVLANKAEKSLGQPISVENNGAGGGSVGLGIVAKAKPDGYRLVAPTSIGIIGIPQYRAVTYSLEDFVPILQVASAESGLAIRADAPFKTLKELVEYARKNPDKVTYSTFGIGTTTHLSMEYIAKKEGIRWTHVPMQGSAAAVTALLGGHVTAISVDTSWAPYVREGTFRLLGTHGEKRMKSFPDVPTFRELGYDYVNPTVFMYAAPKGTPQPIVNKLDETFHKAMDDPDFIKVVGQMELPIHYRNSEQTKKFLQEQYVLLGKMIRDFNIPTELDKGPTKK